MRLHPSTRFYHTGTQQGFLRPTARDSDRELPDFETAVLIVQWSAVSGTRSSSESPRLLQNSLLPLSHSPLGAVCPQWRGPSAEKAGQTGRVSAARQEEQAETRIKLSFRAICHSGNVRGSSAASWKQLCSKSRSRCPTLHVSLISCCEAAGCVPGSGFSPSVNTSPQKPGDPLFPRSSH